MNILLFLVEHVHVLGTQLITFAFEKVFQRNLLCLLYFTLLVGLMGFFHFYFNDYKSIPCFEAKNITARFWPLLSEVPRASIVRDKTLTTERFES